ncbi:hypothetical protein AWB77_03791 [Caballeronia fortuita]|uniref:Lipoprotein n=1 Tax=Caballeronia fortuita TaxID=1777138 RepID=A0A158C8M1_9BURK|nr:hypothetical protein [Caballeronia fortuita]SAK78694.1 hypothetical protein AWB77_03791 [Caballeronia fortuita]
MKAKTIAVLLVASAASSALPAIAHECSAASMPCKSAVKRVSHRENGTQHTKGVRHDTPEASGMQSSKREQHDSIDASYRGG